MPPRIREIKQLAAKLGWYRLRAGKGDHDVWTDGQKIISFDGSNGQEIPRGTLKTYLTQLGAKLEVEGKGKKRG